MMALLHDFGVAVRVTVHTDARAAIGIVRRAGLGKLRHLNVRYLWVQDQVKRERRHLESLGVRTGGERARSAPLLGSLGRRGRRWHAGGLGPQRPDTQVETTKLPKTTEVGGLNSQRPDNWRRL